MVHRNQYSVVIGKLLGLIPLGRPVARASATTLALLVAALAMCATGIEPAEAAGKQQQARSAAAARLAQRRASIETALERARRRDELKRAKVTAVPTGAAQSDVTHIVAPDPKREGATLTTAEKKSAVLAAPPEVLKRIGRHIILGYAASTEIMPLVERGAIGGLFVTTRNAERRNKAALAAELKELRAAAKTAGQSDFWIATDQEGGSVSRLSPPLPFQVSLPRLIRDLKGDDERRNAVSAYAAKQAQALADLGINLNFAPVADLNFNLRSPGDRHTRIRYRAISSDPRIVTDVARTYCNELGKAKVYCTLKHFPGLGRVSADTHVASASLKTAKEDLEVTDWVPFREVLASSPAFLMVGHHSVHSLDTTQPASTSPAVIQDLLRGRWKFEGIVVTDDLTMGAIRLRKGGIAQAAHDSLNAGADLLLVGTYGDQIYELLYALILADEQGSLDKAKLEASDARLERAAGALTLAEPAPAPQSVGTPPDKTKTARQ